jgi:hypothetical protein
MDTHSGKIGNLDIDSILEKINFEKFGERVEMDIYSVISYTWRIK